MTSPVIGMTRRVLHVIAAAVFVSGFATAQAATYYWDNNGSTDGFGTAGGTWASPTSGGASGWSQSSSGNVTIDGVTTSTSDALYFGTDTAGYGLASGTVAVSGAVSAGDIIFGSQSGAITLSGGTIGISSASVLTVNNSSATISGVLSGNLAALTKSGTGTLLLTGANTYTGATTISGGALQLGNGGTTGSTTGTSSIVNNGSLIVNRSDTVTQGFQFADAISGSGSLIQNGSGLLALGNANSYTGGTVVNAGSVVMANAVGSAGAIRGVLTINQGGIASPSAGGWSLGYGVGNSVTQVNVNGGLLSWANPNFTAGYAGLSMVLTGGTVSGDFGWFNGNTSTPTLQTLASSNRSTINGNLGLRLSSSGTLTFDVASGSTADGTDLLLSGAVLDNAGGGIRKTGSGRLVISGNNTYTGSTTISGGALQIGIGGTTGSLATSSAILNNGSLIFDRSDAITQGTHFANAITGSGSLTKNGGGTLTITGNNTYTGSTTINGGAVQIGNGGATGSLSASSSIVNNGSLIVNRSDTVTQGVQFASAISGSGSLIQNGSGLLALGNANTYTGGTVINAGRVIMADVAGSAGAIRGVLTINQGGTASPSASGWSLGFGVGNSVTQVNVNGGLLGWANPNPTAGYAGLSMVLTGGTVSGDFGWFNGNTSTPTLQTLASSARSTIAGNIGLRLTSTGTLTFDVATGSTADGTDLLIDGAVLFAAAGNGGGGVRKTGSGRLVISGSNTYVGSTTISSGALQIGIGGTTGSLATNSAILNNGSLIFDRSDAITQGTHFANAITGSGSLTKNGGGTLTLGQANSYTGGTVVNSGTLTLGTVSGDAGSIRGALTINQGGQVNANAGGWSLGFGTTTSVSTIAVNGGLLNFTNYSSAAGAGYAGMSIVLTGGTIGGESFAWFNGNTSTPTLQTIASSARSTISGGIGLRLSTSGTLTFNVASGSTADGVDLLVSGSITNVAGPSSIGGAIAKTGLGRMVMTAGNSYTGLTQVNAGSLIVNGSLSGDVAIAAGATLGGSGVLGRTLSGAGLVSVGNSPGIGTAGAVDPSAGTSWAFEVTGTAPVWNSGTSASVNDVLRLTDATPFTTSLASGNMVDVLFALPGGSPLVQGDYLGGFFIDNEAFNLAAALANGQFRYWVVGEYGSAGDQQVFSVGANGTGVTYSRLSAYDSSLTASYTVTQQTVNFGSGDVTGAATQFIVVPEPTSFVLAGLGVAGLCGMVRRRRI